MKKEELTQLLFYFIISALSYSRTLLHPVSPVSRANRSTIRSQSSSSFDKLKCITNFDERKRCNDIASIPSHHIVHHISFHFANERPSYKA